MGQHGDAEPQGVYLHTPRGVALTELTEFTQAAEGKGARCISLPSTRHDISNFVTKSYSVIHLKVHFRVPKELFVRSYNKATSIIT